MNRREFAQLLGAGAALPLGAWARGAEEPDAMSVYLERIESDLARFAREQLAATDAAGERLAERVAAGGRLLIFDQQGKYSAEASGRAGGLMAVTAVRDGSEASVHPQDALIIVADEPAAPADLEVARPARERGALVVGICPVRRGAHRLAAACDVALDNYVTNDDAAVSLPGVAQRVGPTSGALNAAILWALTAAYIEAMERRGKPPHIWKSIKRPGAQEFNAAALEATAREGY